MTHPSEAELDKAADFFRKIVEAADASNHNGEVALMKAWRAYHAYDEQRQLIRSIRDVIPMDFLRACDATWATGPTNDLDLVAAVRMMVKQGRELKARPIPSTSRTEP